MSSTATAFSVTSSPRSWRVGAGSGPGVDYDDELVLLSTGIAAEVARHSRGTPGNPVIDEAHYPEREDKEGDRTPRATSAGEAAFLMIGPGAAAWLVEAVTAGTCRVNCVALGCLRVAGPTRPSDKDADL